MQVKNLIRIKLETNIKFARGATGKEGKGIEKKIREENSHFLLSVVDKTERRRLLPSTAWCPQGRIDYK